jgi:hypothetical protein
VMGNLTIKGWSTSSHEIPQPTGILMGRNLRPPQPALTERERVLRSIEEFIANEKREGR